MNTQLRNTRAAAGSIVWPAEFEPARAPILVSNELESSASATHVWAWLIRAARWPQWYPNSKGVALPIGARDLAPQMTFRWSTFGVRLVSHVEEFVPGERVAWNARGPGVWAYHAWLIEPRGSGCRILTEETQYGWVARLGALIFPKRMVRGHQMWIENLDRVAQSGPPPA